MDTRSKPIHILSLGAGVQSSTLALMAAAGEVTPMPVAAIFADTQAEPQSVYRWLDWLEGQLPFPVYRVTAGSLTEGALMVRTNPRKGHEYVRSIIPAFTLNPDGTKGIVGRSCTRDFKLAPMFKKMRELAGITRGQKTPGVVSWIGISLDEVSRMKPSRLAWAQNRWPLIELEMTRHDCFRWMKNKGFPTPPRSACTYCPFHSDVEWRRLKNDSPEDFAAAVRFEKELQDLHAPVGRGRLDSIPFLHDSLVPLGEVDFSESDATGQFKFVNECEGMCGV